MLARPGVGGVDLCMLRLRSLLHECRPLGQIADLILRQRRLRMVLAVVFSIRSSSRTFSRESSLTTSAAVGRPSGFLASMRMTKASSSGGTCGSSCLQRTRWRKQMQRHHLAERLWSGRWAAGQQLIEDPHPARYVGLPIDLGLAAALLRRHVSRRAHQRARPRVHRHRVAVVTVLDLGNAKVQNLTRTPIATIRHQHHVVWLEIPMNPFLRREARLSTPVESFRKKALLPDWLLGATKDCVSRADLMLALASHDATRRWRGGRQAVRGRRP